MTSSKKSKSKPQQQQKQHEAPKERALRGSTSSLPMVSYISIVGVHTTLWSFVALYLPRTNFLGDLASFAQQAPPKTSQDRPQHPFLEALTADPTTTLLYICLGAVVLQSWWAGWVREWWLKMGVRGTEDEKRTEIAHLNSRKLSISRDAWGATFATSLMIHFILILFGAPITSLSLKTYFLALLISIMTVYSPAYSIGIPTLGNGSAAIVNRWTWVRLFAEFSISNPIERMLVYSALGTVIGCWLGVIPIALDWDRPWQAWPLTPAFGAIAGYIVFSILAMTVNAVYQLAEEHTRTQQMLTEEKSK